MQVLISKEDESSSRRDRGEGTRRRDDFAALRQRFDFSHSDKLTDEEKQEVVKILKTLVMT